MLQFKDTLNFKMLLMTASLLTLAACSIPESKKRNNAENNAGTFYVDKSEAKRVNDPVFHKDFSLPIAQVYSFQACIKDNQYAKEIIGHRFEVKTRTKTEEVKTDSNGCLKWSEKVEYNHLAEAKWIEEIHTIKAIGGIQVGQKQLPFALNPWEETDGISLLEKKVENLVKGEMATQALKAQPAEGLWVDDLRVTIDETKIADDGSVLNIQIRTVPQFAVLKTGGKRVLEPITRGEFEAEITLIHAMNENGKQTRRPLSDTKKETAKINQGTLPLDTSIQLKPAARMGQIQLALKLKLKNAPEGSRYFEGVFTVEEFDKVKGSFFSRLKKEFQDKPGQVTIENYLTNSSQPAVGAEAQTQTRSAQDPASVYQAAQVRVLEIKGEHIGFPNTGSLNRKKVFTLQACMRTPLDDKPVRAQAFTVTKTDGKTETLESVDGCITWEEVAPFHLTEQECWQEKSIQISNSNLGMNRKFQLRINPWSEEKNAIRDPRYVGQQELACATGKSKIILTNYSFDKKDIDYEIDPYLQFKMKKEGIFRLLAVLKRPSLMDPSGYRQEALPPGKYLLKWAIVDIGVTDFDKASKYIYQADQKLVEIDSAGLVAESIVLETANLKAAGNTNSLILELESPDDSKNSIRTTYRGTLILAQNNDISTLELISEGETSVVDKLIAQYKADLQKQNEELPVLASKEYLAKSEDLLLVNLKDEKDSEEFRKKLNSTTDASKSYPLQNLRYSLTKSQLKKDLALRFCNYWLQNILQTPIKDANNQTLLSAGLGNFYLNQRCKGDLAMKFFDIHYRYFLKNAKKVKDVSFEVQDITFSHAFSVGRTYDKTQTHTASLDVNAGVNTSKLTPKSPFSAGGGGRYQYSWAWADRDSTGNYSAVQSGEVLMLEKLSFLIRAEAMEKCAVIKLNMRELQDIAFFESSLNSKIPTDIRNRELEKGILLCEGEIGKTPVTITESYYIFNQKIFMPQTINPNSNKGRPLFMAIRGFGDFRKLYYTLGGKLTAPKDTDLKHFVDQTHQSKIKSTFTNGIFSYPGQYLSDE